MDETFRASREASASAVQHFRGAPVMARGLMFGIIAMIVAESVAVHALVYRRWPWASVALLGFNVATVWWLWREGNSESRATLGNDLVAVRHGSSMRTDIPLASVRDVRVPSWQEVPQSGTSGYASLSGGDDPNVLLMLDPPAQLQLVMGIRRTVRVLGLRMETPVEFVTALGERVARSRGRG